MKFDIEPFEEFVYRIPLLNVEEIFCIGNAQHYDHHLKEILSRNEIQEALFIASPDFSQEVQRFLTEEDYVQKNEKRISNFRYSALKYINRICTRPTPFGLFAGCGVGNITEEASLIKPETKNLFQRHARLDMGYLDQLKEEMLSNRRDRKLFRYFTNNSLYESGNEYRYVEYNSGKKGRKHTLTNLKKNEFLEGILKLAEKGATFEDIHNYLITQNIDTKSAEDYIHELINSKILLSELEPLVITDKEYELQLVEILGRIQDSQKSTKLCQIHQGLVDAIKKIGSFAKSEIQINQYKDLYTSLNSIIDNKKKFILQIDSEVLDQKAQLSKPDVWKIKKGMKAYFQLASISQQNEKIAAFKSKFLDRYETATVRLVDVLDPEHGLHYGKLSDNQLHNCPIVDDIPIGQKIKDHQNLKWDNQLHHFLFKKIVDSINNKTNVSLTVQDLNNFSFEQSKIPATLIAFVQLMNKNGRSLINFKNWGSDSAATILGRFSGLNQKTQKLVRDIAAHEEACLPEHKILAEINHLSDPKIGNITQREKFRLFEIPYITKSNSNEKGVIKISDLVLRLVNGKFQLIDVKTKRQVIPILSNAHNFNKDTLPLYRFLCDIQNESDQETAYMNLSLGPISNILDYIPRITYHDFIFRLATWKIRKRDFDWLWTHPEQDRVGNLITYLKEQKIPLQFNIKSGDNKLLIDFERIPHPSYLLFTEELLKGGLIIIEENPFGEGHQSIIENEKGSFYHEIIVPFKNNVKLQSTPRKINVSLSNNENRIFFPGSEWLYFKIYSGIHTRNIVLSKLSPFVETLQRLGYIEKWFFLKYSDPETHLRIRFKVTDVDRLGEIIKMFHEHYIEFVVSKKIRAIQLDSYHREMERYGGENLIDSAETMFFLDSTWTLRFQNILLLSNTNQNTYWLLALKVCDTYMNAFGLTLKGKEVFCRINRDHFAAEFLANKTQKRKILTKYRNFRSVIEAALEGSEEKVLPKECFGAVNEFYKSLEFQVEQEFETLSDDEKWDLLSSFIHMFLLRFLPAKNRKHEYFIYSILENYYRIKRGQIKAEAQAYV